MSIAPSGFRPTLEDIEEENSLPCVLPDGRRRQFRVRGDVQATLLCGLEAPSDNRPSSRVKATAKTRRYSPHFHRFRVPHGGMATTLKITPVARRVRQW